MKPNTTARKTRADAGKPHKRNPGANRMGRPNTANPFNIDKELEMPEEQGIQELKTELEILRKKNEATSRELQVAKAEMEKSQSQTALLQTRLRTWPGVDYNLPTIAIHLWQAVQGAGEPIEENGSVSIRVGQEFRVLSFNKGWCVTNDIDVAHNLHTLQRGYHTETIK